jgi:hypothetical protein
LYRDNTSYRNDTRDAISRDIDSYNDDRPPSYEQAYPETMIYDRESIEEEQEDDYDYGQKGMSRRGQNTSRDFRPDRGLSDDYYDVNSSMEQEDQYNQQAIRNEEYARWQRQNFPSNPPLPAPTSARRPLPIPVQTNNSLPLPIIIPQRRPENKSRGWMIAYPPCLSPLGISQDTFVRFLTDFNKACQASPALDAVNLAAFGVGFAPGIAPMVVSMVVPVAVKMAKNAQTKTQ